MGYVAAYHVTLLVGIAALKILNIIHKFSNYELAWHHNHLLID